MRYYTFKRPCGHTVRGANKAKALGSACLDCYLYYSDLGLIPYGLALQKPEDQKAWLDAQIEAIKAKEQEP